MSRYTDPSLLLEEILQSPVKAAGFVLCLKKEENNIHKLVKFLIKLQSLKTANYSHEKLENEIKDIYDKYIRTDGKHPLTLPEQMVNDFDQKYLESKTFDIKVFDKIEEYVTEEIKSNGLIYLYIQDEYYAKALSIEEILKLQGMYPEEVRKVMFEELESQMQDKKTQDKSNKIL